MRPRYAVGILIAQLAVLPALAQVPPLPHALGFERFGTNKGFPSDSVTALEFDRDGFLWAGTREGLLRFDGYSTRLYQFSSSDPASLSDNYVRTIYDDGAGGLWVATNAGGLNRFDAATDSFESYRNDPQDESSLSHDCVFAVLGAGDGQLWVGTQGGLDLLDPESGRVDRHPAGEEEAAGPPGDWIYTLHEDRRSRVWIATVGAGVAWIEPDSGRFRPVAVAPGDPNAVRASLAFAIEEDPRGGIWIGTEVGLYRFDEERHLLLPVPVPELATTPDDPPIVTSLAFDVNGLLWIATWDRGLVAYDPRTGESRAFRHDRSRPASIGSDRVQAVLARGGDVWIATWGAGVHKFNASAGLFDAPASLREHTDAFFELDVTAILEDSAGRVWLGTFGDGLRRFDPDGATRHYVAVPGSGMTLASVVSLAEGEDGAVWVGAFAGLARIEPEADAISHVEKRPDDDDGLGEGYITALRFDRHGALWVGAGGTGLYRTEDGGATFSRARGPETGTPGIESEFVMSVTEDADDALWVGTRSGGLYRVDPSARTTTRFRPDAADERALSHHYVSSVLRARDGTLFVGTIGGGVDISRQDAAAAGFDHLGLADGLVDPNVVSILEDDDGSLWIATRNGLSRYDPPTGRIRNYLAGDGIASQEFNTGAAYKGEDTLFFGTSTGLVTVRRGTPFEEAAGSPLRITDMRIGGQPWRGADPAWRAKSIEFPYGRHVTVELALLDFGGRARHEYRLGTGAAPWIDLDEGRRVTFADLSPGRHVLEATGRSSRGVPVSEPVALELVVIPPFWMTAWFRGGLVLLVVGAAFLGHRARLGVLERRNRELERLQAAREAALDEARRSGQALEDAYGRLRRLTRRLEDAKEEERAFIARELHDQMGQSLSAAKLDLKALGRLPSGETRNARLGDALALIDGMIDHVRALSLDLRPPLLDELGLVPALRGYAEGQSMRTCVRMDVEANEEGRELSAGTAITAFRIVQEAVNNTLRHSKATRITISIRRMEEQLALTVHDDGHGFDVEATIATAARGGHIGLAGMRERVEALGGSFSIESEAGAGTEIRAVVPLSEKDT